MTSTVTEATVVANLLNVKLIDLVGQIVIFSLIFLLISKEYLSQFAGSPIEKQKADFLVKLPDLAILPFLFVFSYVIIVHALGVLN